MCVFSFQHCILYLTYEVGKTQFGCQLIETTAKNLGTGVYTHTPNLALDVSILQHIVKLLPH